MSGVHVVYKRFQLTRHDNRGDEPVNGHRLAEDDRDEILGLDSRRFHTPSDDAHARRVDAQRSSDDGQRDGERYAQYGPHVRRRVGQEPSDADLLAFAGQQVEHHNGRHHGARRSEERVTQYRPQSHFWVLNGLNEMKNENGE